MLTCGLFAATLTLSLSLSAQQNYRNGFIILPTGDTIKGQIDYREWGMSPRSIDFQDASMKKISYAAGELSGFCVENEEYKSSTVTVYPYYTQPTVVNNDDFNNTPYQKTIFFRVITKGRLSLHGYKDSTGTEYYYIRKPGDNNLQQLRLVSTEFTDKVDGHKHFLLQEAYKDQLSVLMLDCNALNKRIYKTPYTESALRELVFAYNNCGHDTVTSQATREKGLIRVFPMLGYIYSKVTINSDIDTYSGLQFPGCSNVAGGAGVLFALPRNRQQFAFFTDVLYHHFHSRSDFYQQNQLNNAYAVLEYDMVQADIQFRYTYPGPKVRPFIQAGMANGFMVSNKSSLYNYDVVTNTVYTGAFLGGEVNKYQPAWLAGLGVTAGRLNFEARYEHGRGISNNQNATSPVNNFYFLISYGL